MQKKIFILCSLFPFFIGAHTLHFSSTGNLIQGAQLNAQYNARNQLITFADPHHLTSYGYYANGLLALTTDTHPHYHYYQANNHIWQQPHHPTLFDGQRSVISVITKTQLLIYQYTAYGTFAYHSKHALTHRQGFYHNYQRDPASGWYVLPARFYAPSQHSFISRDSFLLPNRYAYAANNPIRFTDPSGHLPTLDLFQDLMAHSPKGVIAPGTTMVDDQEAITIGHTVFARRPTDGATIPMIELHRQYHYPHFMHPQTLRYREFLPLDPTNTRRFVSFTDTLGYEHYHRTKTELSFAKRAYESTNAHSLVFGRNGMDTFPNHTGSLSYDYYHARAVTNQSVYADMPGFIGFQEFNTVTIHGDESPFEGPGQGVIFHSIHGAMLHVPNIVAIDIFHRMGLDTHPLYFDSCFSALGYWPLAQMMSDVHGISTIGSTTETGYYSNSISTLPFGQFIAYEPTDPLASFR